MADTDTRARSAPLWTLLAGFSLAAPVLIAFLRGTEDGPSLAFPFPVLIFISALSLHWAAAAVPTALFFVWNPGLFRGDPRIPGRSYGLLAIAAVLSAIWFAIGWSSGLAVQGATYNYGVCGFNVLWIGIMWVMFARSRKSELSFGTNLLLHWLLFAWLGWYAFPFFGEIT